jgi:hypothetical protein
MRLTKESDALISLIYKEFLNKRESGLSRAKSKHFGGSPNIQRDIAPKWSFEDVDELCRELDRAGLLNVQYADNIAYKVHLSDEGIVYMENRFKDGLLDVLNYLKDIRNFLPI